MKPEKIAGSFNKILKKTLQNYQYLCIACNCKQLLLQLESKTGLFNQLRRLTR